MSAQEWHEGLAGAIADFSRSRSVTPAVFVQLDDGESFYIQRTEPGPGNLVRLHAYPPGSGERLMRSLVEGSDGNLLTPRVVIVHPSRIRRVELKTQSSEEALPTAGFGRKDADDNG